MKGLKPRQLVDSPRCPLRRPGGNTPPSAPYGGQFSYVQQFTVNGSNTAITSVAVTLTNKVGTSNSLSATLN